VQTSTNFLVNQIYSLYQQSSDVASNVDETFVDCYARIQSVLAGSSGFDNASTGSLDQSANDVSVMFLANSICHEGAYSFPTYPSAAAPASSNFTFTLTRSSLGILFLFYFERKFFLFLMCRSSKAGSDSSLSWSESDYVLFPRDLTIQAFPNINCFCAHFIDTNAATFSFVELPTSTNKQTKKIFVLFLKDHQPLSSPFL